MYSDCYKCESSFSKSVSSSALEPSFNEVRALDTNFCWETYAPQTDTTEISTETTGCSGNCYVSAYKYKGNIFSKFLRFLYILFNVFKTNVLKEAGTTTSKYHWSVKRGCDTEGNYAVGESKVPVSGLFGVVRSNYGCTFASGTRCNAHFGGKTHTTKHLEKIAHIVQSPE